MKKLLITLTAVFSLAFVNAQMATVSTPQPLLKGVESDLYHPVLSADGTQLLFSNADYSNLRTYDFTSGAVKKIQADKDASLKAHFVDNKLSLETSASVRTDGSTLFINVNGVEKSFSPVESYAGYVWPSISPDGTKVMFVAAGKGIVIVDLNGNIISRPGKYEAPVWFGNDNILVQNATDDGHQFTSSQILLLNLDGTESQAITHPESMTFSPAASIENGRVVYTTIDGRLYEVNVKLNK